MHLSLSDSYFSLYLFLSSHLFFLCSPVFVDMYTTKQVFCSSCSVATVFIFILTCLLSEMKKNTNNNSHALRQKENPKTKHFSPLVHKYEKRGFFILENLLLFLEERKQSFKRQRSTHQSCRFCFFASKQVAFLRKYQKPKRALVLALWSSTVTEPLQFVR